MNNGWVPISEVTTEMVEENLANMMADGVSHVSIVVCNLPQVVYAAAAYGVAAPRPVLMREWSLMPGEKHPAYSNGWMEPSRALYDECTRRGWTVEGDHLGFGR